VRGARVLFVTATDTGVGKTFVACALARSLRARGRDVGVMKPVASGCVAEGGGGLECEDARLLVSASGTDDAPSLVTPVAFEPPLAPTAAARASGSSFDKRCVLDAFGRLRSGHEVLIVEGIGGLMVPLEGRYTVRDLARDMGAPVLIVARDALGTINHTALTVEAASRAGLEVRGIVLNMPPGLAQDLSTRTNAEEIEGLTGVRVVARLGCVDSDEDAAGELSWPEVRALFGLKDEGSGGAS
jgi:dethiobiotin synthetase